MRGGKLWTAGDRKWRECDNRRHRRDLVHAGGPAHNRAAVLEALAERREGNEDMRIAVVGCSPLSVGLVLAADLTRLGHDVALAGFDDAENARIAANVAAGLRVRDGPSRLLSGGAGPVRVGSVDTDPARASAGARIVFVDTLAGEVEARVARLAPALVSGQHLHVQTHGYWAAFRSARVLDAAGVRGVSVSEGTAPTHAGGVEDGAISPHAVRRNLPLGVFPGCETAAVSALLAEVMAIFEPCTDVVDSNLQSMNFLVHPAMSLLGAGMFDAAEAAGRRIRFYQDANTPHAGTLAEALDAERRPVLDRFGYAYRTLAAQIVGLYGGEAAPVGVSAAVAGAPFYHALPDMPADIWRHWMHLDMPLAHVPYVRLAEALGLPAPLHRGLVDIFGAILGTDFWATGLSLAALGIDGLDAAGVQRYAEAGER